jgi:hypothetical protein
MHHGRRQVFSMGYPMQMSGASVRSAKLISESRPSAIGHFKKFSLTDDHFF